MNKQPQTVKLTVRNIAGVLARVVSHIRGEGWNIKRLLVDETDNANISQMEMEIEGTHTKLALVAERLLGLDCVTTVDVDGIKKEKQLADATAKSNTPKNNIQTPDKQEGSFRILTINPGSTSTKFALYDDETAVLLQTIRHDKSSLESFGTILAQKDFRKECITNALSTAGVSIKSVDAIAGRGGLLKPIESGTYLVNSAMLADLNTATAAVHASALGAIIASELADEHGKTAYVVDPIVVDEMDRHAKLTGMPGVERASIFHALNQKAIARRLSTELQKPYENCRFVVAHLGGGITVGAHRYGRVIDVNDALSGEGAFTPERSGNIPAVSLIKMCFSGEYSEKEMLDKILKNGGVSAYLGTNDMRVVEKMIATGDEFAALVLDSCAYQVAKEIGAMTAALDGRVDAIILTGGLANSNRFTGSIKNRVDRLAPVYVFPGEDEMLALMSGVLRVLRGVERVSVYE